MKLGSFFLFACAALCALAAGTSARAAVITFGSGADQFNMEFVEIGDAGNLPDTTGNPNPAGAVPYTYNIGKFEVSRDMITKANNLGGLRITLQDMTPFGGNGVNRPATGVSWNEAARFVNWLNTSEGFAPAYKFAFQPGDGGYNPNVNIQLWTPADALDYDPSNPFRSLRANYVLPSVDEWYKAAYYDPVSDMYFDYPSATGILPTAVANGTAADTAVFGQLFSQGPADIMDAGGLSAFGIMALGGNVREWEETESDLVNDTVGANRAERGGNWGFGSDELHSWSRLTVYPGIESPIIGLRVVSLSSDTAAVPEPSSIAVWTLLGVCGLWWGRRRLRK